jgi:hypothetical protein
MPIHLPPISRRRFLKGSIAAAIGVAVAPHFADAAAKPVDANTFAFLADTHIAADPAQTGRFALNMTDHFMQVRQEILALETAPAGVIVHGDCAFSKGHPGDYKQFLKLLRPLREAELPIHLALGNHDHLEHFLAAAQPTNASLVQSKYVSALESQCVAFFILDSLNGDPPATPSNPGLLGEAQLQWLARELPARKDKPAIIIVHHTPASIQDWKHLVALIDEHKHVKGVFYGHRHTWGLGKTPGGVHLINLLPTSYPSPADPKFGPAGGATGWTQATFGDGGVTLHVRCIDRDHALHDSVHELKWRDA